jgi:hypothetical protein
MITRRIVLKLAGATIAAPIIARWPRRYAFVVGIPGVYVADYIRARTAQEAYDIFMKWWEPVDPDDDVLVLRVAAWDDLKGEPTGKQWTAQGFDYFCTTCGGDGYEQTCTARPCEPGIPHDLGSVKPLVINLLAKINSDTHCNP